MAKKLKVYERINDTSKTYPRVDPKEVAKALGAKLITDSKEKAEFVKKYGSSHPSIQTFKKPGLTKKEAEKVSKVVRKVCNKYAEETRLILQGLNKMAVVELRALRDYLKDELALLKKDARDLGVVVDDVGISLLLGMVRDSLRKKRNSA